MNFDEPHPGYFTHMAWNIDLRLTGPSVKASRKRYDYRHHLVTLAAGLREQDRVQVAHALEVTAIPPIKGGPRYDLALLVRSDDPLQDELVERTSVLGLPAPELAMTARNGGRFGDTEGQDGEVLLNHFAGEANSDDAVDAWKSVAHWYLDKLDVDNSTLLEYTPDAPFLIMNYAVIPGKVFPFLAGMLLRPSFYSVVRGRLHDVGITPYPLFAKRVTS
ncbi:hypothetical protein [Brachybacterium paraconglomeratum]|uniref:hypothetical protein n=1 Tax=Brachybacterium paraconglomeratum TaxID=173362 RepID=UPI00223B84CE|nr:hypothetical protein [Brachybacterium paraconglomeratum]MCT1436242.1 hypothetical protein [Brachybacterium paraconglomeratum]